VTTPAPPSGWTFSLWDVKTDTFLCDLTTLATKAEVTPMLNRALTVTLTLAADQPVLSTIAADGDPYLYVGTRAVKAYQGGVMRAHCYVWTCEWDGDENMAPTVQVTCVDPLLRLNSRTLYVDNNTGVALLAGWVIPSPTTGGQILSQALALNGQGGIDDALLLPGQPAPALFPIVFGFDLTLTDLSAAITDAPLTIGDAYSLLTDSGACDVILQPIDSAGSGQPAGTMAQMNCYESAGSDVSASVVFEYQTGSKNVAKGRRVLDMSTLGNRIQYLLGPKLGVDHWRSNITGTETGAGPGTQNLAPWEQLQFLSRAKFGTYSQNRLFDSDDGASSARPLYHRLWKTEVNLRWQPRDLLYFTPMAGTAASPAPRPFIDYNIGDIVGVQAGTFLGPAITNAKQRIYGFTVTIDGSDGVERVGELVCSADAESGAG
jgi:hypothetical protein